MSEGGQAEFDDHATVGDIAACFRLLLGRAPNPEEWPGHSARAGDRLSAVVGIYINSREFAHRRLQAPAESAAAIAELEGFRIFARPDDLAVGAALLHGIYEPEVVRVFRSVLRPGMRVIDVGANIGFFTMLAATLVGPQGSVLAIEPNPGNARMAEASRRLNGFGMVTVVQAAAGKEPGMLAINRSFSNGTTSPIEAGLELEAETVGSIPIDSVALSGPKVDFIKLDVEGAEYNALLGCQRLLKRDRPVLVFEFAPGQLPGISGVTGEGLLTWLIGQGYSIELIRPEGDPAPMGHDVPAIMRAYAARGTDHVDMLARPMARGTALDLFKGFWTR